MSAEGATPGVMIAPDVTKDDVLNLNQGWSIGEEAFAEIVRRLRNQDPAQLVECGSGISTVRLAMALPGTAITSLEHLPEWREHAENLLTRYGCDNARVLDAPLEELRHGRGSYESYSIPAEVPARIDALIIDGPPVFITGGREAVLYRLYDRLAPDALVILDDARRGPERRALKHWQSRFARSFQVEYAPAGNGLSFLQKRRTVAFGTRPFIGLKQSLARFIDRHTDRWAHKPSEEADS